MTVELTYIKSENHIVGGEYTESETVLTDAKNYSSIKITPNSIELRVEKIRRSDDNGKRRN